MNPRILIVDDEPEILENLETILSDEGFEVDKASSGNEAVANFEAGAFGLVITDMRMPGLSGMEVLRHVKQVDKDVEVIVLTGHGTMESAIRALRNNKAFDYLRKPLEHIDDLRKSVEKALSWRRLRLENREFIKRLETANTEMEHRVEERTRKLKEEIEERKRVEDSLREKRRILYKRVKELNCLYSISDLREKSVSMKETMRSLVALLPSAWRYPEIVCAKITMGGKEYRADNYKEAVWKQAADIFVFGQRKGTVEVGYLEKRPEMHEGPFLKEERKLLNAITERLGRIIEHHQSLSALQESERYRRMLFDHSPIGLALCRMGGELVEINPAYADILGRTVRETLGLTYWEITPDTYAEKEQEQLIRLRESGRYGPYEKEYIHKDGHLVPVRLNGQIVQRKGENHIWSSVENITEKKRFEEHLKSAKERAEAANRAKSAFLSGMSHELRTPLNAIIGFSQVLQDRHFGELNDRQAGYVSEVIDSGRHLLSLINNVLDLVNIETGDNELNLAPVNLKHLLENCLTMLEGRALEHGIRLDLVIPGEVSDGDILADERKLNLVVSNLLSNAAKFTPNGGSITLTARFLSLVNGQWKTQGGEIISLPPSDDREAMMDGKFIKISVTDTGIGLRDEDHQKIFEDFWQARGGVNGKTPGTGLGLSTAKRLVEVFGGRIWAENNEGGKGSTFSFTTPVVTKVPDEHKTIGR